MLKTIDDVSKLKPTNYRPINELAVQALMDSIREVGVREPIRVFEAEDTKELIIVGGHHRVEAIKRLKAINPGVSYTLSAFVIKGKKAELTTPDSNLNMVLGNLFTPSAPLLDKALGYKQLRESGFPVPSIARVAGVSESLVHKTLAVAELPASVQEWLRKHPEKGDAVVCKVAAAYKRDTSLDVLAVLTGKPKAVRKRVTRTIDVGLFEEQLKARLKLPEATIEKILLLI